MATNGEARAPTRAQRAFSFGQRQADRVVSPQSRQRAYDTTAQFAHDRPILFAFILSQLIFSALPLVLFASFALSTIALAVFSAIVFSLFWIGVALLVLVPVLFATTGMAVLVWLWAVATFLAGRQAYRMLPVSLQGDMQVQMPNGKQVIFQKERRGKGGADGAVAFDHVNIKDEAAEIRD